jgi:hypothetical protein
MPNRFLSPLVKLSSLAAIVACASSGPLRGQATNSCPDWSPKFNQLQTVDQRQIVQSQRTAGWPELNSALSNPSQAFAQGNQLIAMAQSRIQSDRQGLQQIAVGPTGPATEMECKSNRGSAVLAYRCDILYSQDLIMVVQGTLELLQCRSGFAGTINNGAGGAPRAGSSKATTSDLVNSLFGTKLSTPLASQSNLQNFENNKANAPVVGDAAGSEQADASLNASQLASNDKASDPLDSEVDAALANSPSTDSIQNSQSNEANAQGPNNGGSANPEESGSPGTEQPPTSSLGADSQNDSGLGLNQSQRNPAGDPVGTVTSASNDGSASSGGATAANNGVTHRTDPDQSEAYSPQDAPNLLEQGLNQTTAGQVVADVQDMTSGNGQKQLNGMFDIADKANDQFNSDSSSKYVVGQCLPLIHNVYSNAMSLVNRMGQDVHCITDPTCSGVGSATEARWNQIQRQPFTFFSPPADENVFGQ